ncbi:hypothetical protein [Gordonia caeni]|uniref:glycine-rich domain-containing protein n=1 Tax=Gordonia caeni TaxID=1007097 RepID=UPI0031D9932C
MAVATDEGLVRLGVLSASDVATALDAGVTILPGVVGSETATAADWGVLTAATVGRELSAARDAGMLGGWRRTETATAHDAGITVPGAMTGRDLAAPSDQAVRAATTGKGHELAVAGDAGQGWFAWQEPILHSLTAVGSHTISIPPWARYIDMICLGGGGGGSTGNQINQEGYGGGGATWMTDTLDRGEGRNTWTVVNATVGAGGGTQANGQASSVNVPGVVTISSSGGIGRSDNGSFLGDARNGQAVQGGNGTVAGQYQNLTYQGVTYIGGGPSTGDTANVPGSGGRGGGGTTWPLTPGTGRPGGRGQVWIRFRS